MFSVHLVLCFKHFRVIVSSKKKFFLSCKVSKATQNRKEKKCFVFLEIIFCEENEHYATNTVYRA